MNNEILVTRNQKPETRNQKRFGYGHQSIDDLDIQSVVDVLRGDYLTCGPAVKAFEQAICSYTGAKYCVAVANATAGLHIAALAAGLGPGDEAITSPITFLSSANCIAFTGAKPVFADIDPETANIDPDEIEKHITPKTRALIPVHFAGQSCDMARIASIARAHGLKVIEDAAHAIGSVYIPSASTKSNNPTIVSNNPTIQQSNNSPVAPSTKSNIPTVSNNQTIKQSNNSPISPVGSCAYSDMTVFSFHPVKTITTGEGGAVTTNDPALYAKLCALRAHGTHKDGEMAHTWEYEMRELGYNYRITDMQCALGCSQLKKLDDFKRRRREIVAYYNEHLGVPHLIEREFSNACFHLYPILVENRRAFYFKAREVGLNLQVHYIPVHTQPYYQKTFGYKVGDYPKAEAYYAKCISLPLYPDLMDDDLAEIVHRLKSILS